MLQEGRVNGIQKPNLDSKVQQMVDEWMKLDKVTCQPGITLLESSKHSQSQPCYCSRWTCKPVGSAGTDVPADWHSL